MTTPPSTLPQTPLQTCLQQLLADTYVLYTKTQCFHWNVTGPHFQAWHAYFEDLYKDLADAIDTIAEQQRALGFFVNGTLQAFLGSATVQEAKGSEAPIHMLRTLRDDQKVIEKTLHALVKAAQQAGDVVCEDLAVQRLAVHQKAHWQLQAMATEA